MQQGEQIAMEWLLEPQAWVALITLTALEIVLGIDNIVFISILVGRLPAQQRQRARILGLSLAMITRILLLLSLVWVMGLTKPLFSVFGEEISGRDMILVAGGLFLLAESTMKFIMPWKARSRAATPPPWQALPVSWYRLR